MKFHVSTFFFTPRSKEEFIEALVNFQDGCGKFYHYRAYFLAATGIAEFGECSKADEIVAQIVQLSFDDEQLQEGAKAALQQTHRAKAITALVKLIADSQSEYTRTEAAEILGKIAVGDENAIAALVKLIADSHDKDTRREAAESLENILPANQMPKVVTALRYYFKPSEERYKVIWHCAQNLPYSTFYQAWHHRYYTKLAMRLARQRWLQFALCLFLWLSIFAVVRLTVSQSVNNSTEIEQQQEIYQH